MIILKSCENVQAEGRQIRPAISLTAGSDLLERSCFAEGDEFGVAEEAASGPFGVFDFGFDFGAEAGVIGHFVGRHAAPQWSGPGRPRPGGPPPGEVGSWRIGIVWR